MTRRRPEPAADLVAGQAYAVYWSIYTDLRGRNQFRDLYWDRLKQLLGRPAKLVRIEREQLWPSGKPSKELRCHVWQFYRANNTAEAVLVTFRAAMRVAPGWKVLAHRPTDHDEVLEMIWDRNPGGADSTPGLPLPRLTSIMVVVHLDTGFRIGAGLRSNGERLAETPRGTRMKPSCATTGTFTAIWLMEVQTSTKRELMETHWPLLERRLGGGIVEMIDLAKRSGDAGPFVFSARHELSGVTQAEALLLVLGQCHSISLSLETMSNGDFTIHGRSGARDPSDAHWLKSFEARWIPQQPSNAA